MSKIYKPAAALLIVYGLVVLVASFMGEGAFFSRSFFPAVAPTFVYILAVLAVIAGLAYFFIRDTRFLKAVAWALLLVAYLVFFMSYSAPWSTIVTDLVVLLLAIFYFKAVQKKSEVQSDRSG